jgi:hypothetical protein
VEPGWPLELPGEPPLDPGLVLGVPPEGPPDGLPLLPLGPD